MSVMDGELYMYVPPRALHIYISGFTNTLSRRVGREGERKKEEKKKKKEKLDHIYK